MFQLCVTEPVLTSVTRLTAALARRSTRKVLPMSTNCGAVVIAAAAQRCPPT